MKRNIRIEIQVTENESKAIRESADALFVDRATYVRYAVLKMAQYESDFRQKSKQDYIDYQINGKKLNRVFKEETQ